MKINFEFDDNDVVYEVMDAMFVAYLKNIKKDVTGYIESSIMEEDKESNAKVLQACDEILDYYGELNGTGD
jgi:hypothetical protein